MDTPYALTVLMATNAVLLAAPPYAKPAKLLLSVASAALALPLGWWLLNQGLEQQVEKYGNVFSGVQFLLGPDRQQLLPESELLLRWCVLQTAGTLLLAAGLWLGQRRPPCSAEQIASVGRPA